MSAGHSEFGKMLRDWRRRRSLSQLALSAEAEVSQRHLSFLESGRSTPSREMALRLTEALAIPLRQRNALLAAAGFAPVYQERPHDDPALQAAMASVASILRGHEPFPALAVDRHWTMLGANRAVARVVAGVDSSLLAPPVNVLRLSLHPLGLAPRILNWREWRAHVLARLDRQIDASNDADLAALRSELASYPVPIGARPQRSPDATALGGVAVPLRIKVDGKAMALISATTVFTTAVDITLSELAIETFWPADEETAARMGRIVERD